jgi:hypothetical protein
MKRILLMLGIGGALLVPSAVLLAGGAQAANPHGTPPGQGGDPNASCGGSSGGKPSDCNSQDLPFSEGCQHGQAPVQNPHCQPATTTTETTTTTPTQTTAPAASTPASGVAGATESGNTKGATNSGNVGAATSAQSASPVKQLAFTGLNAAWLVIVGTALLGTGLILRGRSQST